MKPTCYGLVAEFDSPEKLVSAAALARATGYRRMDAFSPFPVDGLFEALGKRRTILPLLVLIAGAFGCATGFLMQWYAAAIDYPINVGGRPLNSWPSFVPITFELTVLFAALTALIGMLALNRLPQPYHAIFSTPGFERASVDRFFLCIEAEDLRFDRNRTAEFLAGLGAGKVSEVICP